MESEVYIVLHILFNWPSLKELFWVEPGPSKENTGR